jgi:transcriptional enhancer factor
MPYTDWHAGPSGSPVKQEYIMSTTVDDLSYTPSAEERSRDAAQFVDTGRRSWKTLKGKGEAVWPPLL